MSAALVRNHLEDEVLQQAGILLLVLGHVSNLCSCFVEHLLQQLLALLQQLQACFVVLIRDGADDDGSRLSVEYRR